MTTIRTRSLLLVTTILCLGYRICDGVPIIFGLPRGVTVGSAEVNSRVLRFLNVTSTLTFACTVAWTGGTTTDEFEVAENPPASGQWEFKSQANPGFAVGTTYDVTITCTDATGSATGTITVDVEPNDRLTDCSATVTGVNALTTVASTNIYHAVCQSALAHTVIYNLTTASDYFQIDHYTGNITTKKRLGTIDSTTPSVTLGVGCHDLDDRIYRYCDIDIIFSTQNVLSSTTSLPLTDTVPEDTASGTTLFTLVNDDPDTGETYTYKYNCNPDGATDLFQLVQTTNSKTQAFKLRNDKTLDFEAYLLSPITCDFTIEDDWVEVGPYTYTLFVTDVNEAPVCDKPMYYGTFTEEMLAGAQTINPGFSCTDQDVTDTISFAFSPANASTQFSLNPVTGSFNFSAQYDADTDGYERILGVYCIDSGGILGIPLTGTCYITVTIEDTNDNAPLFTVSSTVLYVDDTTPIGSLIGTIAVTDADDGVNKEIKCNASSLSTIADHIWVAEDCSVYLAKRPEYPVWLNYTHILFDVSVSDQGTTPLWSHTGSLDVIYRKTRTTTVATTTTETFWTDTPSIVAFSFAMLGALILLSLLTFCCLKYFCGCESIMCEECRNGVKRKRPRRSRRPDDSRYRRERDNYRDNYREDYRDDYRDPYRDDPPKRPTFDRYDRYPEPRRVFTLSDRVYGPPKTMMV